MKISKGTITRTILLIVALGNQALTAVGKSPLPFEDETITELISVLCTVGAAGIAWWKNNSFSKAALQADEVMKELKGD